MKLVAFFLLMLSCFSANAEHLLNEFYKQQLNADAANKQAIADLLKRADQVVTGGSNSADAWLVVGVIRAAYAKQLGVSGLSELKQARDALNKSISIDPSWQDGYAKAFLARLYATVPGWPISFGNKKRAFGMMKEVLSANPTSLAANLYEGQRLLEAGEIEMARKRLSVVTDATLPCDCAAWSDALREQARQALVTLD